VRNLSRENGKKGKGLVRRYQGSSPHQEGMEKRSAKSASPMQAVSRKKLKRIEKVFIRMVTARERKKRAEKKRRGA